jgi:hypothetical protein
MKHRRLRLPHRLLRHWKQQQQQQQRNSLQEGQPQQQQQQQQQRKLTQELRTLLPCSLS